MGEPTTDEFAVFWKAYPRKVAVGAARRRWSSMRNRPSLEVLLAAIKAQSVPGGPLAPKEDGSKNFIPHAATWLNGERWLDEVDTGEPAMGESVAEQMARLERERKNDPARGADQGAGAMAQMEANGRRNPRMAIGMQSSQRRADAGESPFAVVPDESVLAEIGRVDWLLPKTVPFVRNG